MKRDCFNALIACALINGTAVAQALAAPQAHGMPQVIGALQPHGTMRVPVAQTPGPLQAPSIDSCIGRLDPQLDIGYDRIAARCPELIRQVAGGAWAPWLPRGWTEPGNDLSAGSLRELRELVERETGAGAVSAAPDVRHLESILSGLSGTRGENGWTRFKAWLRSILERREQPAAESWFTRMVAHAGVSQSVLRIITYAALTTVVLLAGLIVVNEARTAGWLRKAGGAERKSRRLAAASGESAMTWSRIEAAQVEDRPRLLLEWIVRRLGDGGFLPPAGALTVRELTRAARLPQADDRSRLADLALAAERVRYSARDLGPASLDGPLARGRELLDRLNASVPG